MMKINDKHISGVKYIMNKLNKKKIYQQKLKIDNNIYSVSFILIHIFIYNDII